MQEWSQKVLPKRLPIMVPTFCPRQETLPKSSQNNPENPQILPALPKTKNGKIIALRESNKIKNFEQIHFVYERVDEGQNKPWVSQGQIQGDRQEVEVDEREVERGFS